EVTASHWVETDKNLAGGEALCRHLLYTRRYLQHLFGLKPEDVPIDWSPDTFGHAATVPTYLTRGGVKYLYLHRPGVQTPSKPGAFWWDGPDGSRVLVRNDMAVGYNGVIQPALIEPLIKFVKLTGGRHYMFVYGVGDHGGGPTRRDVLVGLDLATWPVFPEIRFSTARAFYEALATEATRLPVIRGELNCEFTGCYTTQTLIKKANRFAEARLADAELACVVAAQAAGGEYPRAALLTGWRDTLFSHFHDILPGSGVHDTRTYTHGLYQQTVATTAAAETRALRRLAAKVNTRAGGEATLPATPSSQVTSAVGAGVGFRSSDGRFWQSDQSAGHGPRPFVVFNPTAVDREEVVEAVIWDNPSYAPPHAAPLKERTFQVRTPDGEVIPAQVVGGGAYWGHQNVTVAFPVTVPALGYARYTVVEAAATPELAIGYELGTPAPAGPGTAWLTGPRHHCNYAPAERSPEGIENEFLKIDLDPVSGGIRLLRDKTNGTTLVDPQVAAGVLEYAVERPHGMSAWSIDQTGPAQYPEVTALRRARLGPYQATIEVDFRIQESTLTVVYELRAGDPRLHLTIRGVWFQRGTPATGVPVLNLVLPLALQDARARYEIPFGAIDRVWNQREEVPALQWAQVSGQTHGGQAGCLLLNDSKHGHSLDGNTLRLTLIRSSYEPDILPEIGEHEIRLAIRPFAGELPVSDAIREGQRFNHGLRVVSTDVHAGAWPTTGGFLKIGPDAVCLSAVKKAEAGNGIVIRVFNPTRRQVTARVEVDTGKLGKVAGAQEIDLLERPVAPSTAKATAGAVTVSVPAHGIASVLVKLNRPARGRG
ncbi:hypothetical protein HQ590_04415, partial [bacterium]|nr:hypothetical protein [bacterium]